MSEFSRETLLNIIETDHVQCGEASALARMALAAMEGEPDCKERKLFCSTDTTRMRKTISVSAGTDDAPLYRHAQPDASHLSRICAESYQVVGALAEALRIFNDVGVIKALDNLSSQELIHDDVLPFSVPEAAQPAPVVPDDVLDALQKVARIRLDMNDFDGDRRGIADCLCDAEEALIEVVNRRAAMLAAAPQLPGSEHATVPGEWIPVSERMPEKGQAVLVYRPKAHEGGDSDVRVAVYGRHNFEHGFGCYWEPSHWMPLPAAPQEVKP